MNTRTLPDPSFHDTVDIIRTGQLSAELPEVPLYHGSK